MRDRSFYCDGYSVLGCLNCMMHAILVSYRSARVNDVHLFDSVGCWSVAKTK